LFQEQKFRDVQKTRGIDSIICIISNSFNSNRYKKSSFLFNNIRIIIGASLYSLLVKDKVCKNPIKSKSKSLSTKSSSVFDCSNRPIRT